jgi:hypothetical protein
LKTKSGGDPHSKGKRKKERGKVRILMQKARKIWKKGARTMHRNNGNRGNKLNIAA